MFGRLSNYPRLVLYYLRRAINSFLIMVLPRVLYDLIPDSCKDFNAVIKVFSSRIEDFFFIQIGSNDGIQCDPLNRYIIMGNWSGILVEPIRYYFDRLVKNYTKQKKLVLENLAISDRAGFFDLYYLKEDVLNNKTNPRWSILLGSFDKNIILSHKWAIADIEKHLVTEKVKTITFEDLIHKHNVKKIDLLHMDVEGHEYTILKSIDFMKIMPKIVYYEHSNLGDDKKNCEAFLRSKGYSLIVKGAETLAFIRPDQW